MTKKEAEKYEEITQKAITNIEQRLNVTFWYYDNAFKTYRFKVNEEFQTLDMVRDVMIGILNVC